MAMLDELFGGEGQGIDPDKMRLLMQRLATLQGAAQSPGDAVTTAPDAMLKAPPQQAQAMPMPASDGVAEARALNQGVQSRAATSRAQQPAAPNPQFETVTPGQRFSNFLRALGGERTEDLDEQVKSRNMTVAVLMKHGLDEQTARAVTRNPQVHQQVLLSLVPTRPTAFDLAPGAQRYDGRGRMIASNEQGKVPPGFRSDGQGGMTFIPGGPGDPSYIRQTTGAKDTSGATLNREQAKEAVGRVKLYKSEADTAETLLGDLGQLRELRKGVGYEGGFFPGARARAGAIFSDGAGQALHSKALEIQLSFTEKTKGAITDREMATFKAATPGLDMADEAAEKVMNGMEAAALRVRERAKFFEAYLNHNRSIAGAAEAWDQFKNEKPVITGDGKGGFKVNRENIAAWKDYVGGGGAAGGGDPLADARAAIAKGAPKDAVIERLRDLGIDPAGL